MPVPRPAAGDHPPYYDHYVGLVPAGDVLAHLERQLAGSLALFARIDEPRSLHRYAEGKWSIKEVVGHLADVERIHSYRALRFARGDSTPLPGFEPDDLVAGAGFDAVPWAELVEVFRLGREANLRLWASFSAAAWDRRGEASGGEFRACAYPYITAGHELHHRRVVEEKYL